LDRKVCFQFVRFVRIVSMIPMLLKDVTDTAQI